MCLAIPLHSHLLPVEEVDSGQDSDFLKEFVVSPDDLTAEAVLGDVLGTDQQQSKMSSKTKQAQPCSPVLERPCMTNSTDSEPPLSPSIDGSQTSASPGSSFTFAGRRTSTHNDFSFFCTVGIGFGASAKRNLAQHAKHF